MPCEGHRSICKHIYPQDDGHFPYPGNYILILFTCIVISLYIAKDIVANFKVAEALCLEYPSKSQYDAMVATFCQ